MGRMVFALESHLVDDVLFFFVDVKHCLMLGIRSCCLTSMGGVKNDA